MPLKVYLDTQDYSALYKGRVPDIYDFLLKKVASKEIEVCFSYPLIAELLTDADPSHKEDRIARAKCIKSLCGKNTFRFIDRIKFHGAFSADGDWMPSMGRVLSLDGLSDTFLDEMLRNFPTANRKQVNALKNKRAIKRLIKENPNIFYKKPIDPQTFPIPVSKKFLEEHMLLKYLEGELPRHVAEKEFLECFTNIEFLVETLFHYAGKSNLLFDNVRSAGESIKVFILKLREASLAISTQKRSIKSLEAQIRKDGNWNLVGDDIKEIKLSAYKIPTIDRDWINKTIGEKSKLRTFPDSFFDSLIAYINAHLKQSQEMKGSDIVDIMHSVYIPYADLWRGDKAFSDLLMKEKLPHKEKIVPTLASLPQRISELTRLPIL